MSLDVIKKLVGETITKEDLGFVDSFVYEKLSVFMPIGGSCGYAVTPKHSHPSYMFVLPYDGDSEVYLEDKKIQTYPNSLFCLSPGIEHHEVQNYYPPKYSAIFIDKEFFEKHYKAYQDKTPFFKGEIFELKNNRLEGLVKDFIGETANRHGSKNIVLENLSILITHEIIRTLFDCSLESGEFSDNLAVNEAVKYININFEKDIDIQTLADISKFSKSHFSNIFAKEMKTTPMQYLKTIRLKNAKKMLLSNQLNITEAAQRCGFSSPAYFTKTFKESFNETPKEFLERSK